MTDSNQNDPSPTDHSAAQSAEPDTDTDAGDCKYVLGESTINHIGESLQAAASAIDGPLTIDSYETWREQDTDSHPSAKQVVMHSGRGDTWGEICNSYDIMISRTQRCDTDTVLKTLQRAAKAVGEPLSQANYEEWQRAQDENLPTSHLIWKYFDQEWRELCSEAGIQPHTSNKYTPGDIRTALNDAAADLGEPLVLADYRSWAQRQSTDRPDTQTIKRHFKDWATACRESDVEPHRLANYTPSDPYSADEIFISIRAAAEAKGEPLSPNDYREWSQSRPDYPSKKTCLRRFDSWPAVCEKAGVSTSHTPRPAQYTDEELLTALKQAAADIGEPVTLSEYKTWRDTHHSNQPSPVTIRHRFGSWIAASEKAGIECGGGESNESD